MDMSKHVVAFMKNAKLDGKTRAVKDFSEAEIQPVYQRASLSQEEQPLNLCLLSPAKWTLLTSNRLIYFADGILNSVEWSEITGTPTDKPGTVKITKGNTQQFLLKSGDIFEIECEEGSNSAALFLAAHSIYGNIQRNISDPDANAAHKRSIHNKEELQRSETCGCFCCEEIFPFTKIEEWVDPQKDTALCPECGIDSVIGSSSGHPITKEFLNRMRKMWFH